MSEKKKKKHSFTLSFPWQKRLIHPPCLPQWFPHRAGLMTGLVMAAYFTGYMAATLLQTRYLNPTGVPTQDDYFTDEALLARVPRLFLCMALISLVMQVVAVLLIPNSNKTSEPASIPYVRITPGMEIRVWRGICCSFQLICEYISWRILWILWIEIEMIDSFSDTGMKGSNRLICEYISWEI